MEQNKLPLFLFYSHYSFNSILTYNKKGSSEENKPQSIIDIALERGITRPICIDNTLSGFFELYENCQSAGLDPIFGYKVVVCNNIADKTPESKKTESKVIIFIKNGTAGAGYYDLVKLHNISTTEGFFNVPRLDWKTLKENFTENLHLAFPFYDNAWHMNKFYGNTCIPEVEYTNPTVFLENNNLPFDLIIRKFLSQLPYEKVEAQTVKYKSQEDFEAFMAYMCIQNRSNFDKPDMEGFGSKEFNLMKHYE